MLNVLPGRPAIPAQVQSRARVAPKRLRNSRRMQSSNTSQNTIIQVQVWSYNLQPIGQHRAHCSVLNHMLPINHGEMGQIICHHVGRSLNVLDIEVELSQLLKPASLSGVERRLSEQVCMWLMVRIHNRRQRPMQVTTPPLAREINSKELAIRNGIIPFGV